MYPSVQHLCYFPGFNRYMVECESFKRNITRLTGMGFNRYMVECEYHMILIKGGASPVLIDTWWNVNDESILYDWDGEVF